MGEHGLHVTEAVGQVVVLTSQLEQWSLERSRMGRCTNFKVPVSISI